jgi:hypothetical protein
VVAPGYSGCVVIDIPDPDPREYTDMVTPWLSRCALKLAL